MVEALHMPDVAQRVREMSAAVVATTPEETAAYLPQGGPSNGAG